MVFLPFCLSVCFSLKDVAALESQPLLGFFLREEKNGPAQKLQFKLYHKNTLFNIFKADDIPTAQRYPTQNDKQRFIGVKISIQVDLAKTCGHRDNSQFSLVVSQHEDSSSHMFNKEKKPK